MLQFTDRNIGREVDGQTGNWEDDGEEQRIMEPSHSQRSIDELLLYYLRIVERC